MVFSPTGYRVLSKNLLSLFLGVIAIILALCPRSAFAVEWRFNVRKATVRFADPALAELGNMPLFVRSDNQIHGYMGASSVAVAYGKVAALQVDLTGGKPKVTATTSAGETFSGIEVSGADENLSVFHPTPKGWVSIRVPLSAVAGVDFGVEEAMSDPQSDAKGSVVGRFTLRDGTSRELAVWSQDNNALSSSSLTAKIGNAMLYIPWLTVESAQIGGAGAGIKLISGHVINNATIDSEVRVYWDGMPAKIVDWTSVSCASSETVVKQQSMSGGCGEAGGCSGPELRGLLSCRFTDVAGGSVSGFIDACYTGDDAEAGWLGQLSLGAYSANGITLGLVPGETFVSARLEWASNSVKVSAKLRNGLTAETVLVGAEFERVKRMGLVLWSSVGGGQVRSVVRLPKLASMELTSDTIPAGWQSSYYNIGHEYYAWEIHLASGKTITAQSVSGRQSQEIPSDPGEGWYWTIRPPTRSGLAGGDCVVLRHGSGFHLLPLYLVRSIDPKQSKVVLSSDPSGNPLEYVRYHPGGKWVATGTSGSTYVDSTCDTALSRDCARIIVFRNDTGEYAVPADQVTLIQRTSALAGRFNTDSSTSGKPGIVASIERKDGSKLQVSEATIQIPPRGLGTNDDFGDSVSACRRYLMGQWSYDSVGRPCASFACEEGDGTWRRQPLSDVRGLSAKDGIVTLLLADGKSASLGKLSGGIAGQSAVGPITVDFTDMTSATFVR